MIIGVLNEKESGETRVTATPASVKRITALGNDVIVEPGAGAAASFPDEAYLEQGDGLPRSAGTAGGVVPGLVAPYGG